MILGSDMWFYVSMGGALWLGLWFLIRPIITWYYKYDKMVENQEEIIELLRKIVKNTTPPKEEQK